MTKHIEHTAMLSQPFYRTLSRYLFVGALAVLALTALTSIETDVVTMLYDLYRFLATQSVPIMVGIVLAFVTTTHLLYWNSVRVDAARKITQESKWAKSTKRLAMVFGYASIPYYSASIAMSAANLPWTQTAMGLVALCLLATVLSHNGVQYDWLQQNGSGLDGDIVASLPLLLCVAGILIGTALNDKPGDNVFYCIGALLMHVAAFAWTNLPALEPLTEDAAPLPA